MQTIGLDSKLVWNASQLRNECPNPELRDKLALNKKPIYLILLDVVDTYNVGTAFRLADAMGISEVWLCGKTECPPNPRIDKASVGTDKWVDWHYSVNIESVIKNLRSRFPSLVVCGVEQSDISTSFYSFKYTYPIALLLGNESAGIPPHVLQMCDVILEIPMFGINKSMNVIVSGAMVIGQILGKLECLD